MGGKNGKAFLGIVRKLRTESLLKTPSKVWQKNKNKNNEFKCSQLLEGDGRWDEIQATF